ncbi:MAG TPA: rRNA maturation RNase YbeY [Marinilabiliaceae bacterium]|jgi:rRNA maturation RNase YbeY|nr:rRNA maturation RNase YbeY [Marinilabiliaceae bacterium]
MEITFQSEGVEHPQIDEQKIANWIESVAKTYNKETGEISYLFCDDNKILEVNQEYLNHDFYTDIITFDYSEENTISGDIIISLQTVESNSQMYKTDFLEELHRVIIHGILHLSGLNDESEEEEKAMRDAENSALEMLS